MKFKNEVWAVIPARSGSKGLKDKNIKIFKNKPLLAHSIISAKKNRFIKKIIFSSDSKRYISIAKKYGCDIYHKRSKKNSSSTSKDIDLFKEILIFLKLKKISYPKYFAHLRPTTPIRKNSTINNAIKIFSKKKNLYSSLKSISINSHNSHKDFIIKNKKLCSILKKYQYNIDKVNVPRKSMAPTYIGNGVIDIYRTKNIIHGKLLGSKVLPYLIKDLFSDIDNAYDLKLATLIHSRKMLQLKY